MERPTAQETIDLDLVRIDAATALRVPESLARRRRILPFGRDERAVYAASLDPDDAVTLEALERIFAGRVSLLRADQGSLDRAITRVFSRRLAGDADPAVAAVDEILHAAMLDRASDLHIEPVSGGARIRARVDGRLETVRTIAANETAGIVNRIKVLSGMDIAERRLPQDGRFTYRFGGGTDERSVDVRVAALPTRWGERLGLRLLAQQAEILTLPHLGLRDADFMRFKNAVDAPHGLVLLTGPTGCGKTTTLYAALRTIDLSAHNVITIEDPIEYDVPGVSQVEIETSDRMTFARALRSALRHDPDVLMIGEIRDLETAEVAVRASLTGHLVLSTLHTNSAAGAVTRLVEMGVPRYLVEATLRLSLAQRLVRRVCRRCRKERALRTAEARALAMPEAVGRIVYDAAGCAFCRRSGYVGRIGVFEAHVPGNVDGAEMSQHPGTGLLSDAAEKVLAGLTTPAAAIEAVECV